LPETTVVSAPPVSVTSDQAPKVAQAPLPSVASARSTTPLDVSTPDCASVPSVRASGTLVVVYHGPPASAAVWPAGAVESAAIVIVSLVVAPAPFVALTVRASGAVAPAVQA